MACWFVKEVRREGPTDLCRHHRIVLGGQGLTRIHGWSSSGGRRKTIIVVDVVDMAARGGDDGWHPQIAFMGEDSQVNLFPVQFNDIHPFPSYNMWNFHMVNNVFMLHLLWLFDRLVGMRMEEGGGGEEGGGALCTAMAAGTAPTPQH